MRVNIYQVDSEKDVNRTKFRDFRHATTYGEIDPSIYKCVFKGFIKGEDLEDIWRNVTVSASCPIIKEVEVCYNRKVVDATFK